MTREQPARRAHRRAPCRRPRRPEADSRRTREPASHCRDAAPAPAATRSRPGPPRQAPTCRRAAAPEGPRRRRTFPAPAADRPWRSRDARSSSRGRHATRRGSRRPASGDTGSIPRRRPVRPTGSGRRRRRGSASVAARAGGARRPPPGRPRPERQSASPSRHSGGAAPTTARRTPAAGPAGRRRRRPERLAPVRSRRGRAPGARRSRRAEARWPPPAVRTLVALPYRQRPCFCRSTTPFSVRSLSTDCIAWSCSWCFACRDRRSPARMAARTPLASKIARRTMSSGPWSPSNCRSTTSATSRPG